MTKANRQFVFGTLSSALLATACTMNEEFSNPLDSVQGGAPNTATDQPPPNGGQTGSSSASSSSVRPSTGGLPSTGGRPSTDGRTNAGGQITTSARINSATGGSPSVASTGGLIDMNGGFGNFPQFTGLLSRGGFSSILDGGLLSLGGMAFPTGFGFGGVATRTTVPSDSSTGGTRATSSNPATNTTNTTDASGPEPVLPVVSGTCPTFKTGTVTVAGLSGISLQVGPKKEGTGSLVLYWHGTGSSSSEANMMLPASVREEILNQGGIIASFQGSLGTGGDCSGTAIFSKDDFKVADQLAACAVRDHGIDPRRIYTTGCSAGGLQSGCMASLRSSYLAASVPNSGGEVMTQTIQDSTHIPAVMTMHGGAADMVGVSFSQTSATFDKHMDSAGGFVINCNHGGGHCGAPAALYTAAWEFMKAHPFGTKPSPYASGLPTSFPSYCSLY